MLATHPYHLVRIEVAMNLNLSDITRLALCQDPLERLYFSLVDFGHASIRYGNATVSSASRSTLPSTTTARPR